MNYLELYKKAKCNPEDCAKLSVTALSGMATYAVKYGIVKLIDFAMEEMKKRAEVQARLREKQIELLREQLRDQEDQKPEKKR